jgi:hypothetical protein
MGIQKPPCELASTDECTPKSALGCLKLVQKIEDELPRTTEESQYDLQESVKENRELLEECLVERFLSGQFGAPRGPLT